jgi:hypothetical protein
MDSNSDVISVYSPSGASNFYLPEVTTIKVKPYHIKNWAGYDLYVRALAGNYIEADQKTVIILVAPSTLTLIPLTPHPYWAIL